MKQQLVYVFTAVAAAVPVIYVCVMWHCVQPVLLL